MAETEPEKAITPLLLCVHLKTTNKSAKYEILKPFLFLFRTGTFIKGFSSKRIALKVDVLRTGKYTVCRHVRASFSPEILQAGAVKELMMAHLHGRNESK